MELLKIKNFITFIIFNHITLKLIYFSVSFFVLMKQVFVNMTLLKMHIFFNKTKKINCSVRKKL